MRVFLLLNFKHEKDVPLSVNDERRYKFKEKLWSI